MKVALQNKGFSLLETMVGVSLFVFIILIAGSFYSFSQKTYNKGAERAELTQNIRVAFDRLTRELRQSVGIVTVLPPSDTDLSNPPANEIFFQDGHDISRIIYIKYYLDGNNLKRSKLAYFFLSDPEQYVLKNSLDNAGNPPEELIIEDRVIGEYFNYIEFWETGNLVYISTELEKNDSIMRARTGIYGRN